eukprot:CAMPEP_0201528042 /NCGR_PEP_ID=MMETSP0161_2-20130828/37173_1 /ASSEMBLY_ACC=CAM_ASM_000251 /TAXON_ID=180227 /ORGANISM="Neoparamoeba aestuarina, Strain SoJaBio B1-5/56/2" /LENGTH=200 /DNA_ID=CAMNT_0047929157 /DNA_START=39 /DNA_END=638 /DNA_ORIENTATION=-
MNFQPGGGAATTVGQPGKTMFTRPMDEYTRPMTREDYIKAVFDPKEMSPEERALFKKISTINALSTVGGFAFGFYFSRFLPWKRFEALNPPKHYRAFGRTVMGFGMLSVSFVLSQRWGLQQIMNLGEDSPLLFHTKRFLMSQRGNMMFARSEMRVVTKDEIRERSDPDITNYSDKTMSSRAPDGKINAEFSLSQDQFLPI